MAEPPDIEYRQSRPAPALRPYVECLWTVRHAGPRARRREERIVPDACPEIIVHLGDAWARHVAGRWMRQPRAFLAGTLSRPWRLRPGTRVHTVGIRFRPGTVTALFALDMARATDREVALADLVGVAAARALVRGLRGAAGGRDLFRVAEAWLAARLGAARPARSVVTGPAVAFILQTRGQARIEAVARGLGVGRRRLERAFARDLGIRPKLFARIVRLNAALAKLGADERARSVDLALDAGYFDQAHLSRDFRAVAGRGPGARRGADGPLSRHFTEPARLLVLLAGE